MIHSFGIHSNEGASPLLKYIDEVAAVLSPGNADSQVDNKDQTSQELAFVPAFSSPGNATFQGSNEDQTSQGLNLVLSPHLKAMNTLKFIKSSVESKVNSLGVGTTVNSPQLQLGLNTVDSLIQKVRENPKGHGFELSSLLDLNHVKDLHTGGKKDLEIQSLVEAEMKKVAKAVQPVFGAAAAASAAANAAAATSTTTTNVAAAAAAAQSTTSSNGSAAAASVKETFMYDFDDNKRRSELQLPAGQYSVPVDDAEKKSDVGEKNDAEKKIIKTLYPVYRLFDARFYGMPASGDCLLISVGDFNNIQKEIPGVFGSPDTDHTYLITEDPPLSTMVVWKIPKILKKISGWVTPSKMTREIATSKTILNDTQQFYPLTQQDLDKILRKPHLFKQNMGANGEFIPSGTKIRIEFPQQEGKRPSSVHHLEVKLPDDKGTILVPGLSTRNLLKEQKEKIQELLIKLEDIGIRAYICNAHHNMLIFYEDGMGNKLTPVDVAKMLLGPNGAAIKEALKEAGVESFSVEEWAKSFIRAYETVLIKDMKGEEKRGELQIPKGKHQIRSHTGGTVKEVLIKDPVYRLFDAHFKKMPRSMDCLLMNRGDFESIRSVIHGGAFGSDYLSLSDGRVVVWKIPADLKTFTGWIYPSKMTKSGVGTEEIFNDNHNFYPVLSANSAPIPKENKDMPSACVPRGTKMRMDFPKTLEDDPPSVHHIEIGSPDDQTLIQVPGIATASFFINFDGITPEEKKKIPPLLAELQGLGIKAYMCSGKHHMLIFYKDGKDQQLTPRDVANMLRGSNGTAIKNALQKAGAKTFSAEKWAQSFIRAYGGEEAGLGMPSAHSTTAAAAAAAATNIPAASGLSGMKQEAQEKEGAAAPAAAGAASTAAAATAAQSTTQQVGSLDAAALERYMGLLGFKKEDREKNSTLAKFAEGCIRKFWMHTGGGRLPLNGEFLEQMIQGSSNGSMCQDGVAISWQRNNSGQTYYKAMSIVRNVLAKEGYGQEAINNIRTQLEAFRANCQSNKDAYNAIVQVLKQALEEESKPLF